MGTKNSSKHFYTMPGETNIVYKLCSSRFDMFNHNQQFSEQKKSLLFVVPCQNEIHFSSK